MDWGPSVVGPAKGSAWITVTPRTPGRACSRARTASGGAAWGWPSVYPAMKYSATMSRPTSPPVEALCWATMEAMTPKAELATKRATMSPLTARKAARGLSARRRPAISVAGRAARRARTRDPTMVSQGPATMSPARVRTNPVP